MNIALIIILIIVIIFIGLIIINYYRLKKLPILPDSPNIKHLTANTFNQHIKGGIAIVDFWAEWCMPCKVMMPILNELANTTHAKFKIYKVNVDQQRYLAERFKIRNIPTLIIFKNGKEVKRLIGVKTKEQIVNEINKLL